MLGWSLPPPSSLPTLSEGAVPRGTASGLGRSLLSLLSLLSLFSLSLSLFSRSSLALLSLFSPRDDIEVDRGDPLRELAPLNRSRRLVQRLRGRLRRDVLGRSRELHGLRLHGGVRLLPLDAAMHGW